MADIPEDTLRVALRRLFMGAPLFLPLAGVVGCLQGGQWWALSLAAVVSAHLLQLRRIFICILLCIGIAFLHDSLQQRNINLLQEQIVSSGSVELEGTVERMLNKGCILSTGVNGVRVVLRGDTPWHTGDRVRVTAVEQPLQEAAVEGMFDTKSWMKSQGLAANLRVLRGEYLGRSVSWYALLGAAESVREHLTQTIAPPGTEDDARRQVLCALALGDKSLAEQETLNIFKRGGCLHAFAVSGLHVGIVAGFLYTLAYLGHLSPRTRTVLVLTVVGVFVIVTGLAVPALRAYLMIMLVLLGLELRRRVSMLNIWSFAALLILLVSPWQLHNAGFVLSFAVYAGLGIGVRLCMNDGPWFAPDAYLPRRLYSRVQRFVCRFDFAFRGCVVVSLSAWLVSLPITMAFFHSITPISYLTNIAISPLLPFVMGAGLLSALTGWIPYLGAAVHWCALQGSALLIAVTEFFAGMPMSYLPAVAPQPQDAVMVCNLGYGESVTVLGNPGVVIGCGSPGTAGFRTEPSLFFSGFTPVALLTDRRDAGSYVLKNTWPELHVIDGETLNHYLHMKTTAGEFLITPPPQGISLAIRRATQPLVLWKHGKRSVLYIGNADSLTLEALPDSLWEDVGAIILGHNEDFPVDIPQLLRKMSQGKCILLPNAPEIPADAVAPGIELLRVTDEKPLLRFTLQP